MKIFKQYWQIVVFCIVSCFSSSVFAALVCGSGDFATCITSTNDADVFKASWEVKNGDTLNVNIQAETTGWLAIGFHKPVAAFPMDDTDFVMGGFNGGTYGGDYFYTSTGTDPNCPACAPTRDSSQDTTGLTGSETNGVTSLSFSRLLTTSDSVTDYDLKKGRYDIVWAFRASGAAADDLTQYHSGGRNILASNVSFAPVPVPAAIWLFGSAIFCVIGSTKRSKI